MAARLTTILGKCAGGALCAAAVCAVLAACNPTRYVPEGSYLLDKVQISGAPSTTSNDEMIAYVRQRPNVRVLGFWRLDLDIYNLSDSSKHNGFNNWLRTVGAEPVVHDSTLTARSREQIKMFLQGKGYLDAQVRDTMVVTGKKKCRVEYHVDAGNIYRISDIDFSIADDSVRSIVMADTTATLLKVGAPFDTDVHDKERARITRLLHENGYFHFGKDYIYFVADSSKQRFGVNDSLVIVNSMGERGEYNAVPHRKAVIDEVVFVVNRAGVPNVDMSSADADTLSYGRYRIFYRAPMVFNPKLLTESCFIVPGAQYRASDVELTQARFNSLKLFNGVGIRYVDVPSDTLYAGRRRLRCIISLHMGKLQSYSVDVEGTNSSGNLGGAANLRYRHNNLFRGAEVFDVKCRIASQNQFARDGKERFFTVESGVEMSLSIPKFLTPFDTYQFNRRRNPNTVFTMAYDFQRRPDFTRTVVSAKYGYNWRGSRYVWHTLTPVEANVVNIPSISDEFSRYINGTYLQYSYTNHFIMSTSYTFLFNQQKAKHLMNAWFLRFNIETAGNTLSLLTSAQRSDDENFRDIMGIRFSQYVKSDIEARYQVCDMWNNNFVYRLFAGIAVPYGNSRALPFEKSYFVGGANSIRAWPVRGLGPGSSHSNSNLRYHNQTSDIRLEMNAEYRFKLFSVFEGAIFADAGNIWALRRTTDDAEAHMGSDFYKQIAVGSGLGLRLNFDYFVLRFDAAVKLHDPAEPEGRRWVIATTPFTASDINYNFAIGYPF